MRLIAAAYARFAARHGAELSSGEAVAERRLAGFTGPGNQLLEDGTFRYEYDSEGNRVLKERLDPEYEGDDYQVIYDWDYRQRLTDVTFKDDEGNVTKTVHYEYDVFDRLVARTVDPDGDGTQAAVATIYTAYDGDDVLLDFVDTDSSGGDAEVAKRYLHGPVVDQILAEQDAGTGAVLYHLADNLGSVRDLIDTSGAVANHIRYDAYGNVVAETSPGLSNRYQFTGREFDNDTGLQYNRARWYDPAVGRWLSQDPIGFGDGPNPYLYVGNSPTNATDPSGLRRHPWQYVAEGDQIPPEIPAGCSGTGIKWRGSWTIHGGTMIFGSAHSEFSFSGTDSCGCIYVVWGTGDGPSWGFTGGTYNITFSLGEDGNSADVWPVKHRDTVSYYVGGAGGAVGIPLSVSVAHGKAGSFTSNYNLNAVGGINVFVLGMGASTKVNDIHYSLGVPPRR